MTARTGAIRPGTRVLVRDAHGEWLPATARGSVEHTHNAFGVRIHDFPCIPVSPDAHPERVVPWPAEYVMPAMEEER